MGSIILDIEHETPKMVKNNKMSLIFSLCLSFSIIKAASLNRQKRQTETDNDQAEIKKFHVNSRIQLRYAITNVETQMQNKHSEAKEVFFDMYIPKEAFVSNFTMTIKGKTYLASVETKEKAQNIYNESTDTSGLIQTTSQPEFTDGKQVTFSAKLDPAEKVTFNLRYEELLERSEKGKYHYEVNIQPKNQKIDDFKIKVTINESLPLDDISVTRVKDKDEAKFQAEDISKGTLVHDEKNSSNFAIIEMRPNDAKNNGKDWKFVVNYDVQRPDDGNDVQIGAGKFVHYFAPDKLPTMPKHVIFVIDISGSMSGRKLQQTKDAMTTMLDKMSEKNIDNFNIILFDSNIQVWGRKNCDPLFLDYQIEGITEPPCEEENDKDVSYSIEKNNGDVGPAYDFVLDLNVRGSTNINDALLEAIKIAKQVKQQGEMDTKTQQMIVFLTDGQPSAGETRGPKIKENVRKANAETNIPIYGLALGGGVDFNLIKDISDESNGFAERIYESGNSFEQLENFYSKISDPKLKDVSFEYIVNGNRIVPENLTSPAINQVFGSNEYSIVGTLPESEEINEIKVVMKAKDQMGIVEKLITIKPCILPVYPLPSPKPLPDQITPLPILPKRCFPIIPPQPQPIWEQSPTEKFMERLWAYKRINYLSDNDKTCSKGIDTTINDVLAENIPKAEEEENEEPKKNECEKEAIRLALEYNFVTDLTSLVIEENDEYINKGPIQIGKKPASTYPGIRASGGLAYSSYAYSAPAPSPNLQLFSSSVLKSAGRPGPPPRSSLNRKRRPQRRPSRPQSNSTRLAYVQNNRKIIGSIPPQTTTSAYLYTTTTTQPPVTFGFCKMIMYDETYFRGQSIEISGDVSDFNDDTFNFDNEIASLKIEGDCCWTLFTDSNFQGVSMKLNVGEYQSPTNIRKIFKKASSAQANC